MSIPTAFNLSIAPIHNSKSGLIGFFTITGISTPFKASAISCTANGLTVVLAPNHRISISSFKAASTCNALATSVATGKLKAFPASFSQDKAGTPIPSNELGLVLGFQIPPLRMSILLPAANCFAISWICSSFSTEQGPAIVVCFFTSFSSGLVCNFISVVFPILLKSLVQKKSPQTEALSTYINSPYYAFAMK